MDTIDFILTGLATGIPVLIAHVLLALAMFAISVRIHMAITPVDEHHLIARGNVAAGVALSGALLGMAIPLAATLATSQAAIDIALWGAIALLVQLSLYGLASKMVKGLRAHVEAGNVAVGLVLAASQVGVSLLVAAAMAA